MSREVGLSPLRIAQSYLRLAAGPGRVSFRDFTRLRLFDKEFHADSALGSHVGQRRNRDICVTANYRHDWLGLVADKVASSSYLAAYGLPVIAPKAVFAPGLSVAPFPVLGDQATLERFLLAPGSYPLFGKPVDGFQSLGSIALRSVQPLTRQLEGLDGTAVSLDSFVSEIMTHFSGGYVFQEIVKPHQEIVSLCGERLACVRVVTALCEDGPRIMRGALKIPAGKNIADNYWRPGNLLAQIDPRAGRVLRVVSGVGLAIQTHSEHPDTGAALIGFEYPQWAAVEALALEGARVMQHVPLIGWDIAATARGPLIVEMNATPDLFLVQLADRRGILDQQFSAFMAYQARCARAHLKRMKARLREL